MWRIFSVNALISSAFGVSPMKSHSEKSSFECRVLTLMLGLVATIACAPPSLAQLSGTEIAQNPADLIPPAPEAYATGNTVNSTLGYGAAGQPLGIQNSAIQNTAQNVMGYRVFIPSDNVTIFEQAKAIEPTAFVQTIDGQRVIQVGLFGTEALALQQVGRFQAQGMPVRLQSSNQVATSFAPTPSSIAAPIMPTAMPATMPTAMPAPPQYSPLTVPAPPQYSVPNSPAAYYPSQPSQIVNTVSPGYYVVIPTASTDANYIQSQLNQLGIPPQYFFLRDRPFGLHYAIGTFSKRTEADRLTAIVRERTKFDARVYHER
jgi:hypothetical protein